MKYRVNKKGKDEISNLGFGCMRFQKKQGSIDLEKAEDLILHAIDHGVNYFDTAYVYPGSEVALGTILAKHNLRPHVKIATKLPHYMLKNAEALDKYFNEQCRRLQTDYIDYYLIHMLPDIGSWQRLCDLGITEWIASKKESGQIKQIGFSYHGNTYSFMELIDAYEWDFCYIQYNYMDEHSQAGRKGLQYAASKDVSVIVMEPLRGGRLVNDLPKKVEEAFEVAKPKRSPAEWALRWLWDQVEVTSVLSGMNTLAMLDENIRIASDVSIQEMGESEAALFDVVRSEFNRKIKVGCTGCGYCMPCPKGVDIPGAFCCYEVSSTDGYLSGFREYMMCTSMRAKKSNAGLCTECGKCEKHCPQNIEIRHQLKNVKKVFETPIYKLGMVVMKRFSKF